MRSNVQAKAVVQHRKGLGLRIAEHWQLYALLLVPILLTFIYKYIPMYGIQIAFRDYRASRGIWGSEWVGLHHLPGHPLERRHHPVRSRQGGRRVGLPAHFEHRRARPAAHGHPEPDHERRQFDEHRL